VTSAEGRPELPRVDVVTPVHNEAASIEAVLRELCTALGRTVAPRVIVCEDGSTDGTPALLGRLATELPLEVRSSPEKKGYARAIIDGLRAARAPWVLAVDSDGQLDPEDFSALWGAREGADVVMGRRTSRRDSLARRAMSRAWKALFDALFHPPVDDPSCPYVLMTGATARALADRLGTMEVGLWWEFVAQAHHAGLAIRQVPVRHRPRAAGESRAIPMARVPRVAVTHTLAMLRLRRRLYP
jgi:dolichol-phosphate mannosyltransferase